MERSRSTVNTCHCNLDEGSLQPKELIVLKLLCMNYAIDMQSIVTLKLNSNVRKVMVRL